MSRVYNITVDADDHCVNTNFAMELSNYIYDLVCAAYSTYGDDPVDEKELPEWHDISCDIRYDNCRKKYTMILLYRDVENSVSRYSKNMIIRAIPDMLSDLGFVIP
jgi:hypothetical protein